MSWPLCMNFRDLGGLPTNEGEIRKRSLFRAGDLALTTPEDGRVLAETLGIRTYVDLRTDYDIEREGSPRALVDAGIQWVRLPVDLSDEEFHQSPAPRAAEWGALYARNLTRYRETWLQLLRILAEAEGGVVFGCVAGKDRTGISAACLLTCLGVPEDVIVDDYAKTTAGLAPFLDRWSGLWGNDAERRAHVEATYFVAYPDAMRVLLAELREQQAMLFDPALVKVLRQRYVVPR